MIHTPVRDERPTRLDERIVASSKPEMLDAISDPSGVNTATPIPGAGWEGRNAHSARRRVTGASANATNGGDAGSCDQHRADGPPGKLLRRCDQVQVPELVPPVAEVQCGGVADVEELPPGLGRNDARLHHHQGVGQVGIACEVELG